MSKIELPTITSGYNLSAINNNFQKIEDVLNKEVLYRKGYLGEPNEMQTNLDMNGKQIINIATGTSDEALVTKVYVDQGLSLKFDKSGGPMSGSVDMSSNEILNVSKLSASTLELGGVHVVPTSLVIDPYNGTMEALSRSYAEAGYNVIGTFQAGFTYVNTNDVGIDKTTGKGFTGPAGPVAAGTDPTGGSFVDRSSELSIASRTFRSFGATGLGFAGDAQALQDAIDWAGAKEGRRVYGNPGDVYRIDFGLVLKRDGKSLFDQTSACVIDFTGTKLVPNVDNIICFAVERNYATVIRPVVDNRAARTGITAYLLGPKGLDTETTKTDVMFSEWTRPMAMRCKNAFVFQPGPTVSGVSSGMYYHTIYSPYVYQCEKGFHFRRCVTGDNKATRISIYTPRQMYGNCMFDIDNAETLDVYSGTAEFVNDAGEYANAPTIKITKQGSDPYDNSFIRFHNFVGERGGVPFDFDGSCFYNSLINPTFVNYAGLGVYSGTSDPYAQITNFEGPVYSQAQHGLGTRPRIGAAVRPGAGTVNGQIFLEWDPSSASFYHGRLISSDGLEVIVGAQGFKISGQVKDISAENIQNKASNSQILGTSDGRVQITGDVDKNVRFYNTEVGSGSNGFLFGGANLRFVGPYGTDNVASSARAANRWSVVYAGTGTINTSDAREKTEPLAINDAVLDAWGDVQLITFKWLESVRSKGEDDARWHFGVIAQQVRDAFAAHGLDGTHYGLLCYDEWGDEFEDVLDESGRPTGEVRQVQVAGNRWGIRPDQCLFLEAAYQRRNYGRLLERVEALESK